MTHCEKLSFCNGGNLSNKIKIECLGDIISRKTKIYYMSQGIRDVFNFENLNFLKR